MKKFFMFITIMISLLLTTNAYAKTCKYTFDSNEYGPSAISVEISGGTATGYFTMFNGVKENDLWFKEEKVSWSLSQYNSKNQTCPYYLLGEKSGFDSMTASYDWNTILNEYNNTKDKTEAHIFVSETIKEDKAKNGDAYNKSTDSPSRDESNVQQDEEKAVKLTCYYRNGRTGDEASSGVLKVYSDGSFDAYMTMVKGTEQTWRHDNHFDSGDTDEAGFINGASAKGDECPYYMIFDDGFLNNSAYFSNKNDPNDTEDHIVMASTTIKEDKKDWNEKEDREPVTHEDLQEEAKKSLENHEDKSGLNDDYDPGNLYADTVIGENFCEEEEVMTALKALGVFIIIAKFAIPMIIIIMGVMDMVKTVNDGTPDSLKTQAKIFGKRVVLGLAIMFGPTIFNAFLSGLNQYQVISDEINQCQNCLLDPFTEGKCSKQGNTNSVDAPELVNDKSASADELNNDKSASAGELNDDKSASAGELGNDKSASGELGDQNKNASGNLGDQNKNANGNLGDQGKSASGNLGDQNKSASGELNNDQSASADQLPKKRNDNVNVARVDGKRNNP